MKYGSKRVPNVFYWIAAFSMLYCYFYTPNFWISILLILYPIFAFKLFWIDNEPNIIFWGMMLQWVPGSTQLLYCDLFGITLAEKFKDVPVFSNQIEYATWLNLLGIYTFSLGLFAAIRGLRVIRIADEVHTYQSRSILIWYVLLSVTLYLTQSLVWVFAGLSQFIYILSYIKWGFFLLVFYVVHKRAEHLRLYFYAFLLFEFVLGLSSFFAGQIIMLVLFIGLGMFHVQPKLRYGTVVILFVVGAMFLNYLVLWSAVKREYREYVSQGQITQSVLVSSEDARSKLFELMNGVDDTKYRAGIETLVNRIGYIQFFAASVDYVPRVLPYQYGDVYLSAIQHYLVPRFLNPDKVVLDDSKHTSKFTGLQLSGLKEGSSFSLGYIADAYIDFGPVFMHVLLFGVGWFFGFTYNFLVKRSLNNVWIWVITAPYLLLLNINGADTHKAIGSLLLYFLSVLIVRSVMVKLVESFLRPTT